jgi:hypothetical protein
MQVVNSIGLQSDLVWLYRLIVAARVVRDTISGVLSQAIDSYPP